MIHSRCPVYNNLPSTCRLVKNPRKPCCQIPECYSLTQTTPKPTPSPTPYTGQPTQAPPVTPYIGPPTQAPPATPSPTPYTGPPTQAPPVTPPVNPPYTFRPTPSQTPEPVPTQQRS